MTEDYKSINKIIWNDKSKYEVDTQVTLNLGRYFEGSEDDFFGQSTIKPGDKVGSSTVMFVGSYTEIDGTTVTDIILTPANIYEFRTNTNPFPKNDVFSDKLWEKPGIISKKATKIEIQKSPELTINSIVTGDKLEDDKIQDIYFKSPPEIREFIMNRWGNLELSKTDDRRQFPKGINERWMRNRFLQTASYLNEVFAFPDDLTREVFLSTYLTKNGSCILSGSPGSGKSVKGDAITSIRKNGIVNECEIGKFIDGILGEHKDNSKMDFAILNNSIEVMTMEGKKAIWKDIKGISRHFFDGSLIEIITESEYSIQATPDHSFIIKNGRKNTVIKGDEIRIGDAVPTVENGSIIWDNVKSVSKKLFKGYVYDFEVDSNTNSFMANNIIVHNTVLVDVASLLFMNAYGFSNFEYKPSVQDILTGKTPHFIYKDLSHTGDTNNDANILTTTPNTTHLARQSANWVILQNIETTSKTGIDEIEPTDENIEKYLAEQRPKIRGELDEVESVIAEARQVLKGTGKDKRNVKIGIYTGPIVTQKYSRNRVDDNMTKWESKRFDEELLATDYGIIENEYYTKALLRQGYMPGDKLYVSDITYDIARYPDNISGDDSGLVQWKDEVETEKRFLYKAPRLAEIDAEISKLSKDAKDEEQRKKLDAERAAIMDMRSNIHKKADMPQPDEIDIGGGKKKPNYHLWAKVYGGGRKGLIADEELLRINREYTTLYGSLKVLVEKTDNTPIFNARRYDDILEEMKSDIGLTTCSENKTPEEILYTTEITLVKDQDSMGRPMQQYVFQPSPLDFVTKPGKFLNEFARADKDFQDQLLSLLDRRLAEHRGERFKSPDFILFADNNPHKLLTAQIDWALWDRIDIELFLKGATLGTKDMVLTRRFGREDQLMGRVKPKNDMERELLERIKLASEALNQLSISKSFYKDGVIEKKAVVGEAQGIVPLRFRELKKIWGYVNKVSIPSRILHLVYLLTTTMNQSWYVKKVMVNDTTQKILKVGTEMIPTGGFAPYGATVMKPRDKIVDFSMLGFASEFLPNAATISNFKVDPDHDKAKEQFPLGITRPVGIRFVISLLRFAKSLAWLRRGNTEVTEQEIYDLFPVCGSHRLSLMPFGTERLAGVDDSIKKLYPNIQDFLKYAIIDLFWKKKDVEYLDYYDQLESIINAGYLNVDGCPPGSAGGAPCPSDTTNIGAWQDDVVVLDIMNGVEFAKRNTPEYKTFYNNRLEQINHIASLNYYDDFLVKSKENIETNDKYRNLFEVDTIELQKRIDILAGIFHPTGTIPNPHIISITSPFIRKEVAVAVVTKYLDYIDPSKTPKMKQWIAGQKEIFRWEENRETVKNVAETVAAKNKIKPILDEVHLTSSSTKEKILKAINEKIADLLKEDSVKKGVNNEYPLKQEKYGFSGKLKLEPNLVTLEVKTFNEHLMWRHLRYGEEYVSRNNAEESDQIK